LSVVTVFVAIYAIPYLEHYAETYNVRSVNALTALFVFGMQGVLLSTNIIGFMTFWEIMSVTSFFLVLADGSEASRKAGFLYLVMTHLGAGAIMAGLFLLSGGALLSDFSVLAMVTPELPETTLYVALALLLFGFGSKAGLVPFHVWLPEAHPQAPTHVSALMSGVMLKIALYGFLRVLLFMLPGVPTWFMFAVVILGVVSAVVGVLYAVLERDIKRLLAYSSIENLGLIFTMIGVGLLAGSEGVVDLTQAALYAALFLAAAHAIFKSGLFLASGIVIAAVHSRRLEAMGGLAKRMPQFSVAVCVLALTAAAMPPFGAFVAEWTFLQAMVGALGEASPMLQVALVVILAAVSFVAGLALFAMVKMYAIGFLAQPRSDEAAAATEPAPVLMTPVIGLAFVGLLLGLFSPLVLNRIGAVNLAPLALNAQVVTTGGGGLAPLSVVLVMAGIIAALLVLRRLVSNVKFERAYQTWDCGQPITPRMEYTATAFSAPIRFFFRFFLRSQKIVTATPVTPNNPWVSSRSMSLLVSQVWYDGLYAPMGRGLTLLASWIGRLQNGSIQFYISLILLALFVTLIVAL
jgi:hydrogenase-4 component B